MARGFLDDKIKLTWNMQRVLLPKNRVKLLLNMLVIAVGTIPRGGTLMVDAIGEGEATGFRLTTSGLNARISQALPDLLAGSPENGTIDAHAVQPFYTGLLAKACGVGVTLTPEGDGVVVATSEAAPAAS
jgi:histidine phosphotransferase ChpT